MTQALMGPVLVEVRHISPNDVVQVAFAEDQDMIKTLAPDAAEQALDKGIGAGCVPRRVEGLDADPGGNGGKAGAKLVIVVADQVFRCGVKRGSLPQLLGESGVGRMPGHPDVHDLARPDLHDEEQEDIAEEHVHRL